MGLERAVQHLNSQDPDERVQTLLTCCHCRRWAMDLAAEAPFESAAHLEERAEALWSQAGEAERLEAFAGHPQIGGDLEALRMRFAASGQERSATWSGSEQAQVALASEQTLQRLAAQNRAYREKFGFIFIVCATGKSADEMLALLEARLPHDRDTELSIAAGEQAKITRIRLEKLP